jgi:hypothetical protein
VFQVVPLSLVWIWYALPYAVSQLSWTPQMLCVLPRSIWSHCGSDAALDQRVPLLPSTAAEAGVPAFSVDEAVAVLFSAALVVLHAALLPPVEPKTWNSQSETPYWVARWVV